MFKYHEITKNKLIIKLRNIQEELPTFCSEFFRGIESRTSVRTRISYAYDLVCFFKFIKEHKNIALKDIKIEFLDEITIDDIEEYLEYLNYFISSNKEHVNDNKTRARKLASIRSMYKYFSKKKRIKTNPAILIDMPKIAEKSIIRLETDEMSNFLKRVETGKGLTASQQKFHNITKGRDMMIVTLLLLTGIRVSECVGLDINDIDFKNDGLRITRKGGNEVIVYFGIELKALLLRYLEDRKKLSPVKGHEDALFLSIQNKRIGVRSIQKLVKKYSGLITKKKISPHKLRSTYGTNLYRETGDIYLVADMLGHKDVNTTKKHYADIDENRKKKASNIVKLRYV